MTLTACKRGGCTGVSRARGMCANHYASWRTKEGRDAAKRRQYSNPEEAFAARIKKVGECIVWTGAINNRSYGQLVVAGRVMQAHRYAWERVNGPIPQGMIIDHMCWNKACVNVEHLRLGTQALNVQNLQGARRDSRTGVRGVTLKKPGLYVAQVQVDGVVHYAYAKTIEEAEQEAISMRRRLMPFSQERYIDNDTDSRA